MVTIHDLSRETGYSITTVSKALNGYTDISTKAKNLIIQKANELGYLPNASARSLVTKKSWTIGVVFEEETGLGITHPFFSGVLDQFKKNVEEKGYDILFISQSVGSHIKSYYDHCLQKGVDGIIILSSYIFDEGVQKLINSEIPSVIIDCDTEKTNCVFTDNFQSLYDAVTYLHKKGHKNIAHIHGDLANYSGLERWKGYNQALEDLNIPFREDLVFSGTNYTINEGYQAGLLYLKLKNKPTAIVAASDQLAIGFIRAIEMNGLSVPGDVSVIGFDDIQLASLISPALTTIHQNKKELADAAAECLLKSIDDKTVNKKRRVIDGTIIERETVRALNR